VTIEIDEDKKTEKVTVRLTENGFF